MTDPMLPEADPAGETPARGGRRRGRRQRSGCLPMLVLGVVLLVGVVAVLKFVAWPKLEDLFAGPEDFPGPGSSTEVTVVVDPGQSISSMGAELEELGVVKSSEAFVDAAKDNPDSSRIQAATYLMRTEMKAADAVAFLADPKNAGAGERVTVPEGARVDQIVDAIVKKTDFTRKQVARLLSQPARIGLPAEAEGNPEGYLFPATYTVTSATTAESLLSEMVAKTAAVEKELRVTQRAGDVGLTPHEVITLASIVEYEANRAADYPKVARVFFNRLDQDMALQSDATVSYVSQRKGDVWTTAEERASESLYNTYRHTGLPPGPIGSPGKETIEAVLSPAEGNWLYFVPDFEKGITLFTADYQEHLANAERAKEYCRTHDEC